MSIGWEYERPNGNVEKIVISEGFVGKRIYALICPHCGSHRLKLIGFGKETIKGKVIEGIAEIDTSSDEIETLILECEKCKEEVKYGADNAVGLLNKFASAIDHEWEELTVGVCNLLPEVKMNKNQRESILPIIQDYALILQEAKKLFNLETTDKTTIVKLLNDHAALLKIIESGRR